MSGTAVARTQDRGVVTGPVLALPARQADLLEQARGQIEPYLPRGIDFQAVIADVFLATRKNPDLLKCEPESLVLAVVEVQQRGLRIGSTCHLVPKGGKVCAWNDYRGDIEMIVRSGACRDVQAFAVYEHETFQYAERANGPDLYHEIVQAAESRGDMKGAYAKFYLGMGRTRIKWMPLADIDAIRQQHSLQWKKGKCPEWYALKTVIRQGAKLLPKNPALARVYATFARDEQEATETPATPAMTVIRDAGELVDLSTGEIVETPGGALPENSANTGSEAPAHGSLAWAQNLPLPLSRSEFYGKPLGTLAREYLELLPAWCETKMTAAAAENRDVSPVVADLYNALQLLLEVTPAGAGGSIDDEDVPGAAAPAELPLIGERQGAPAGSQRVDVPKPGKVQDALAPSERGKPPIPHTDSPF